MSTRHPKLFAAVLAVSTLTLLAAPPAAVAQNAPAPWTHNASLLGKPHSFSVPGGWTVNTEKDSMEFKPPAGLFTGDFTCFVLAVAGDFSGQQPKEFAKLIAASQQKDSMPWGAITDPDDMTFVGMPAGLISIGGTNPANQANEAMIILVAPAKELAYAFVVRGKTTEIQANADALAMIINGVTPTGGGSGVGGLSPGGSKNGSKPDPGGCVGFGCNTGPAPSIDDPPWGLGVQGLTNRWRVENDKGSYVFMVAKPEARVTVSHRFKDNAGYKASMKKARGQKAKLGKYDALVVESAGKKTWHVTLGTQVTVIELAANDLRAAEADALPEFVKALTIVKKDPPPINNYNKGVRMTVANGVSLELGKGWFFNDAIAAGATLGVKEKSGGFTMLQLRTGSTEGSADPFSDEYVRVQLRCKNLGGKVQETKVQVTSAQNARQSVCLIDAKGANAAALKDVPKIVALVEGRGMQLFLFAKSDGTGVPEARVAEFLQSISLPR